MNTDNICFLRFWRVEDGLEYICNTNYITSSPGSVQTSGNGPGILVCAMSAVFIWSRGIMFVHYQLYIFDT